MSAYSLKKEDAMDKVKTFLNLSCVYKITDVLVDEVIKFFLIY